MDGLPPSGEASKGFLEEAAIAASSTHQYIDEPFRGEIARDGKAIIIPFRRAVAADTASPPPAKLLPALILVAPIVGMPIPDFARQVIANVVANGACEKNVPLAPDETGRVVNAVLAGLDLADLYCLSMGEPATAQKTGQLISDTLDEAALQRLMLYVLAVENKENAHDPAVVEIVAVIAKEVVLAATSGSIIWPDIAEAVGKYYGGRLRVRVEELPDGTTITVHLRGGQPHRDEQEGAALILHDTKTGALRREGYYDEGNPHRAIGPAVTFHDLDGTVAQYWYRHGALHRDAGEDPAAIVRDSKTGAPLRESYFCEGNLHRAGGPAETFNDPELGMTDESWFCHGKLHRDPHDGPAREYRDDVRCWSEYGVDDVCHRPAGEGPAFVFSHWQGQEISGEEYVEHGVRHRSASDGPALRCRDRAGNPVLELWCERGERHRDSAEGPAWRGIEDGRRIEEYYWHGKLHRDPRHGPAMIVRDTNGAIIEQEFWVEGEHIHVSPSAEASHGE